MPYAVYLPHKSVVYLQDIWYVFATCSKALTSRLQNNGLPWSMLPGNRMLCWIEAYTDTLSLTALLGRISWILYVLLGTLSVRVKCGWSNFWVGTDIVGQLFIAFFSIALCTKKNPNFFIKKILSKRKYVLKEYGDVPTTDIAFHPLHLSRAILDPGLMWTLVPVPTARDEMGF